MLGQARQLLVQRPCPFLDPVPVRIAVKGVILDPVPVRIAVMGSILDPVPVRIAVKGAILDPVPVRIAVKGASHVLRPHVRRIWAPG